MSRWRFSWPGTLSAQMIVVVVVAVLVSNATVVVWFALGRERLNEDAVNERVLDRAASVATLMAAIPAKSREEAAATMSSGPWRFSLLHGKPQSLAMSDDESELADRARALLPESRRNEPVTVKFLRPGHVADRRPRFYRPDIAIQVILPVVRGTQLNTLFFRPPPPHMPAELIISALAATLIGSLAAAYVARRVARPLSQLAASASEAARGGSAHHVAEEGPADVRRAAAAFNAMTDQVTRTLESQRQLLSAVGHDLRTPITALKINTEFVADQELRERLQKNLDELQELTEAVLSAAKGVGWEEMRRIDLAALVESLCADLEEMGQPVSWAPHAPAPIACRSGEIRRAVRNLVENAMHYGKRARVRMEETADAYDVVVEDDGPGIPDADRGRVFEPFVRLEASRSTETGGTGLGLTLVKAIAEGHGGSIALENRPEGGLRARLSLPRGASGG